MTLEALSTLTAIGTFVVIAASAIAALAQLRHLRVGNQLSGLLTILQIMQGDEMRQLLNFVRHGLALRLEEPRFCKELDAVPIDRAKHPELYVCQFFDHIGGYVRSGLIEKDVLMNAMWYDIGLYWSLLEPVIKLARNKRPFIFENFEYLGALSELYSRDHPKGNYPADLPPMGPP